MLVVTCKKCKKQFNVSVRENILFSILMGEKAIAQVKVTVFCPHCDTKYMKQMSRDEYFEFIKKL